MGRVQEEYKFSVNNCFKVFDQSFNRMKYFSCLSRCLGVEEFPIEWSIEKPSGVKYEVKAPKTLNEKQRLLEGYEHFIHCYLVRDCIESFAFSLDRLFFALLLNGKTIRCGQTLSECLSEEEKREIEVFESKGLGTKQGKIQKLEKRFGLKLTDEYQEIISGLKDIRNCLSHGNGFVRISDGKDAGKEKRKFTWKAISIYFKGRNTGKKLDIIFNKPLSEPMAIFMGIEEHEKSFRIGEQLSFTPSEAYEIAFSLQQVGRNYLEEIRKKIDLIKKLAD